MKQCAPIHLCSLGLKRQWRSSTLKAVLNFFDTPFGRGEEGIPINGLVWMGTFEEMFERLETKLKAGFRCIKIKIGAIDFDRELQLIRHIRSTFSRNDVELRVDANGGFTPEEALSRMEALVQYDIHSIEQPIKQHQWTEMARLCTATPLPIGLDEELIGVNERQKKIELLDTIRPQYIVFETQFARRNGWNGGVDTTRS